MLVINNQWSGWWWAHPPPTGCLIPKDIMCPSCMEEIKGSDWTICHACNGYVHRSSCATVQRLHCIACSRTD